MLQGKNVFDFESAGYPGDVVMSCEDLTIEHPEYLKIDGATLKRSDYPSIEKKFTSLYVKPTYGAIRLCELAVDHYSTDYKSSLVVASYKNDLAIIGIKRNASYNSDITTYISHDGGLTFETNTCKKVSTQYDYYGKTPVIMGDCIIVFHTSTTTYNSSGYVGYICSTDGGKTWSSNSIDYPKNTSYSKMTLKAFSFGGRFMLYFNCGTPTLLTKDPTNTEQSMRNWDEIDISNLANTSVISEIKNGNKFMIGGMFNGMYRILNDDYTYVDGNEIGLTSSHFSQDKIFYNDNTQEYVCIKTSGTQTESYVSKSKDLFNWTEEIMEAPKVGTESSDYGYYFDIIHGSHLFQNTKQGGSVLCRDFNNYSKVGAVGSGGSFNFGIYYEPETNLPYFIYLDSASNDTKIEYRVNKIYLYDVEQYFTLPSCKKIDSIIGGGSYTEAQYPFIRTE